jgi:outer membrane protein OmpA-like peptidoglycan-associated protein
MQSSVVVRSSLFSSLRGTARAKASRFAPRLLLAGLVVVVASLHFAPAAEAEQQPFARRLSLGAMVGGLILPTNSGLGNAHFDEDVPASGPTLGLRLGYGITSAIDVEAEVTLTPSSLPRPPKADAMIFGGRLLGRYTFMPDAKLRPFVTAGLGQMIMTTKKEYVTPRDVDDAYLLGVGALYQVSYRLAARADLRWIGSNVRPEADGIIASNIEATVGLSMSIGGPAQDSDGDGISNATDKCIDQAEDKDGFEDDDGCPDLDNDGDGIIDTGDRCPLEAEDKDGFEDDDGCPDLDNDGDGIPDTKDKCPLAAEDKDGFQDDDGCPDLDNDGDGVPDKADKCPDVAEDKDGFEDGDGCPEPDNDGDGILDANDKCPDEAETVNGFQDTDGCPDAMPAHIAPLFSGPIRAVTFTGSKLRKSSSATLEKLLELLLEFDTIKIEIHVHTAGKKPEGETELAQKRGEAIRQFFIDAGIDTGRFMIMAHGAAKPISTKTGRKAWAENERVEFAINQPSASK